MMSNYFTVLFKFQFYSVVVLVIHLLAQVYHPNSNM